MSVWLWLRKDYKSTLMGLSVFFGVAANAMHFDATGHLAMTPKDWFAFVMAFGAGVVGKLMIDAGSQMVRTPDGDLKDAPAHQTPNDPRDTPVKQ